MVRLRQIRSALAVLLLLVAPVAVAQEPAAPSGGRGVGAQAKGRQATQPATATARPTSVAAAVRQGADRMVVYKSPTCTCCSAWVDSLRASGFTLEVHNQDDARMAELKTASGVPAAARSCHTAQIGGYVIEGHVPVATIRRLLRERPQVAGIAVGGMVAGTLGMEVGSQRAAYDVTSFNRDGRTAVYERH